MFDEASDVDCLFSFKWRYRKCDVLIILCLEEIKFDDFRVGAILTISLDFSTVPAALPWPGFEPGTYAKIMHCHHH